MQNSITELQIDEDRLRRLIALAREEDLGTAGDISTQAVSGQLSAVSQDCAARIVAQQDGVICGLAVVPLIFEEMCKLTESQASACADVQAGSSPPVLHSTDASDSGRVAAGAILGTICGARSSILSCERVVLNFLQRLSGVATLTRRFVDAAEGSAAKIYDTRKTTPGWRDLEKYAVRCGGGHNHRRGLHDAILVKDNHLAGVPTERLAQRAFEILNHSQEASLKPAFVEFEVDSLEQFEQLLKVVGIDVIMLDNFSPDHLRQAVELRDRQGLSGKLELEASGGITLDTVRTVAESGVERISVGALTHSAVGLDISMEITDS